MTARELYREAQRLIAKGQPVFPCYASGERAKRPMTKNGFKDASLDRDQIKKWLKSGTSVALAIPTGIVWDVLDVDVKNGQDGRRHLPSLQRLGLLEGCQKFVRTPSGGWHLYFKAHDGLTNKANAALGLDVRTKGGYVLIPPSLVETDDYEGHYEDLGAPEGGNDQPLVWDLILNSIAPTNERTKQPVELLNYERRSSVAFLRGWLSERVEGERNRSLYWATCRCIENGIDPHELVEVATVGLGLPEDEVLKTIGSAIKAAGVKASDLHSEAEALFG